MGLSSDGDEVKVQQKLLINGIFYSKPIQHKPGNLNIIKILTF